ncbi:MAG: ATP-dependent Clp protease ATP-binding subunit ClpA [Clostridium sp.]|uniref:ATP-dependent Clp protease ATP-binding subunit ClpA n=1 Tax=Clostridium sp. TaxID=1506 RepID=UPI001D63B430|nr:ATP-dependent Clp protease ATP-binding subunit ClpA [Clostridium sp.]MBS5124544.1 ATP-dependent Clp protease ATP-binding subunit ClpA [Clostridium sp.]
MQVTKEVNEVIVGAIEFARENKHEYVTAEHILYKCTFIEKVQNAMEKCGADIENLRKNLNEYFNEYIKTTENTGIQESYSFQQVILTAGEQCMASGKNVIEIEHILSVIYMMEDSYALYFLNLEGIDKRDLLFTLCHEEGNVRSEESEEKASKNKGEQKGNNKSIIEKYTVNLNEFVKEQDNNLLVGRQDVLDRTVQILCRRTKNNPIHVGEPGVGKTSIVLGLARLINEGKVPEKIKNSEIYSLDIGGLLAGTKYRGDFEERIKKVLDQIKHRFNPIVYIDEIHSIVGAGALGGGSLDASNLLKPYLMEGKIKFIGATTFDEYKKHFEKDKALTRRFQTVEVKEPSISETIEILNGIKKSYEEYHNVSYTDQAIESAVILSNKYINDKFLPDKAIDVIDEAGASISMENSEERALIDEVKIEEIISKMCHIPKKTVEKDEIEALMTLENKLKSDIFGQNAAIDEVVKCIKMSRAGLKDEGKPVASMLFVGPTGVGKTEICRVLSKELGIKLIRFDMSEYGEKHAASKLIGAPPGYVGYEEGGILTDSVRKNPYCVLLLDEIEKAHPDILSVLLQVMDYATLTDNQGRKADFRNVILIMTSNAGAKEIGKNKVGFGERVVQGEAIKDEVKRFFTPEFRNRLDKIVVFNHIDKEMAINITIKEIGLFKEQLLSKNIILEFDDSVINHISSEGVSKEYGAREISRIINSEIKALLIDEILFGRLKDGGKAKIIFSDSKYAIEF